MSKIQKNIDELLRQIDYAAGEISETRMRLKSQRTHIRHLWEVYTVLMKSSSPD